MLRLRTNVTVSPTSSRRSSSATAHTSAISGPRAPSSVTSSSTPTSSPSRTPSSTSPTGPPARAGVDGGSNVRGATSPPLAQSSSRARPSRSFAQQDREAHGRVQPLLRVPHVLRVHGEARCERLARGLRRAAQQLQRGPRALRVHVVGRQRRDAAPVVDARRDQVAEPGGVGQVRWCLHVHRAAEHEPGERDRTDELVGRARWRVVHLRPRLREEVLHDHFLDVTVTLVRRADRQQRVEAFLGRLAEPDEDPGGEGDAGAARRFERRQPPARGLVRRAVVRAAGLVEPVGERLEHHPLRRADRAEALELRLGQGARVGVGEQARSRRAPHGTRPRGSRRSMRSRARRAIRAATG